MDLLQLRYFMLTAEHRNITKAANLAFTSQSNVSKQIAHLETELGVQILKRKNTGVELTPAGQALYDGLSLIIPKLDALFDDIQAGTFNTQRPIRLGLSDSLDLERVIPDFWNAVSIEIPDRKISLETHPFEKIAEKLVLGDIDIAITFSVMNVIPGLQRIPLNRNNPLIYYSKRNPLFQKEDLTLEDFKKETFIIMNHKLFSYDTLKVLPFKPVKIIETNSLNAVFSYVQANAGVTVLGQNQIHYGKELIASYEIQTTTLKVGADALWIDRNNKELLSPLLCFLREKAAV